MIGKHEISVIIMCSISLIIFGRIIGCSNMRAVRSFEVRHPRCVDLII